MNTRKQAGQATSAKAFIADTPDEDDPLLAFRPYQHKQPRSNSITPDLQRRFIATLAATGIVRQAARSIGRSLEALYRLRGLTGAEGFAEAWEAALRRGVHRLEDCALERAIKGVPTPIVSGGKMLGTWDKPDNGLLRFLLQYRLPAIYSPKAQELGPGHPLYEEMKESRRSSCTNFKTSSDGTPVHGRWHGKPTGGGDLIINVWQMGQTRLCRLTPGTVATKTATPRYPRRDFQIVWIGRPKFWPRWKRKCPMTNRCDAAAIPR